MALLQATLEAELLKMFDSTRADFAGWPSTPAAVADAWATAYGAYAADAQDPSLDYLAVPDRAGFVSALSGALPLGSVGGTPLQAAQAFEAAFVAYWTNGGTGAVFSVGALPFLPGFATEVSSVVSLVAPGVLQGLLVPAFGVLSGDPAEAASRIASAFHTATTTAITVLITGTTAPPGPITFAGLIF